MPEKLYKSTVSNRIVDLDGSEYVECVFKTCMIRFAAIAPSSLISCSFEECKWEFVGPASNTLRFMAALYAGGGNGGKQLISDIVYKMTNGELGVAISPEGNNQIKDKNNDDR